MYRLILPLFSALFLFANLAEALHRHENGCDAPCPGVCMGSSCGIYCDEPAVARDLDPVKESVWAPSFYTAVFVHQTFENEIFHPPVV